MSDVNADLLAALKRIAKIGNETPAMGRLAKAQNIAFAAIEVAERDAGSGAKREQDAMNELDGEFSIPAKYQ
jgi:hypothetical protein